MAKKQKEGVRASDPFTDKIGYFSVSEFCITGEVPPKDIFDAIIRFHINEINPVREALGKPVSVSRRSGYRPRWYEESKKRSGTSQHSYEDIYEDGKRGATDYTASDIHALVDLIFKKTSYRRVCFYPNDEFVHCDHKGTGSRREYYECESPTSKWKFIKFF